MALILSAHARVVIEERGLALAWIERAIQAPDAAGPDPSQPTPTRSFKRIEEAGGRVLRAVHRAQGSDMLVITAFFDRGARP
jgi:hypothetical protein